MRIAEELVKYRGVTGLAGVAAGVIGSQRKSAKKKGGRNRPKKLHYFNLTIAAVRSFARS
jgi:hypothetical protein